MANSHSGQDGREYPFERRRRPHRQPGARVGIYLLTWAMAQGLVENNPVIGTAKNEEKSRDRVLTPAELRLIWNALEDTQHSACIKLLALTGQRLAEIGGLRWSEIHDGQIILPAERTKNARP